MSSYIIFFYSIVLLAESYSEVPDYQLILNDNYIKADEYNQSSLSTKAETLSEILRNRLFRNPTQSTSFIDSTNLIEKKDSFSNTYSNKNTQYQPSQNLVFYSNKVHDSYPIPSDPFLSSSNALYPPNGYELINKPCRQPSMSCGCGCGCPSTQLPAINLPLLPPPPIISLPPPPPPCLCPPQKICLPTFCPPAPVCPPLPECKPLPCPIPLPPLLPPPCNCPLPILPPPQPIFPPPQPIFPPSNRCLPQPIFGSQVIFIFLF